MKVKKIGDVELTFPLWWTNYNNSNVIQATAKDTITGGVVVWQQTKTITGLNIDLSSLGDGWQDINVKDLLKLLVDSGNTTTITLADDTVVVVRFRYEDTPSTFKRLVDVSGFEYYSCEIKLARTL